MRASLVSILDTRCGRCLYLERMLYEDGYRCPQNRYLPTMIEPFFAIKCVTFKMLNPKIMGEIFEEFTARLKKVS